MRYERLPNDSPALTELVRDPASDVQVIICAADRYSSEPFLILPMPILVPPLSARTDDLPRIVDEYALDAIAALGAPLDSFAAEDRAWIVEHSARDLNEIAAPPASSSEQGQIKRGHLPSI